jgi:hypothetical protein
MTLWGKCSNEDGRFSIVFDYNCEDQYCKECWKEHFHAKGKYHYFVKEGTPWSTDHIEGTPEEDE